MTPDPAPRTGPGLPSGAKAWLLLDVDGVLNVIVSNSVAQARGLRRVRAGTSGGKFTVQAVPWVGKALASLTSLAPAWCTSWMREVDYGWPSSVCNAVGLPKGLPVVDLAYYNRDRLASKVDGIIAFVGNDPFIWVDDAPNTEDAERLAALPNPNLFILTDEHVGITQAHVEQAARWVAAL